MFIRTRDTATIITNNNESTSFLNINRKGNVAKQFNLINNKVSFINEELVSKMIPKKDKTLNDKEIKIIITEDNNTLIYQDFKEAYCRFLQYNEDDDEIILCEFDELVPNSTNILCYNKELEDYYFSKILILLVLQYEHILDEDEINQFIVDNNNNYTRELGLLSNYILFTQPHNGLIINNILII